MRDYDAVLVLSCNPMEEMMSRINTALPIYFKKAYGIGLSGSRSEEMRKLILETVKLESEILLENISKDTVGNAVFSKMVLALPKRWKSLAVVSSDFHIPRVRKIFDFVYGKSFKVNYFGAKSNGNVDFTEHEKNSLERFRNDFRGVQPGDNSRILERLFERHELYKDNVYLKRRFLS